MLDIDARVFQTLGLPRADNQSTSLMPDLTRFVQVQFNRFKAFNSFTLHLRGFNILVGPNNAGKSTILTAFRILAAAMRRANSRSPEIVRGPSENTYGYPIELAGTSVAEENIFFNYDESEPASISFRLTNGNELLLYFAERGSCVLLARPVGRAVRTPAAFRSQFNCPIGFVPILGPVDQHERLYDKEAARRALFNYGAARNFRNIWHHYPEHFEEFRSAIRNTWPGMDIDPPEVGVADGPARLYMFCPEERIPREIFWAGFGFQVWCQMLTHLIQSKETSLFLIDEPDIYLHSELQRQLLALLRNLGPDILIATHSLEIISDAEPDDIVLINKKRRSAKRIKQPSELLDVFSILGTGLNPILTQLAKTKKVVFVEGKDFQIIGKFAAKLSQTSVANRRDFAVVPVDGFNPERARTLRVGMETTLGGPIRAAAILDRDYRSDAECDAITSDCRNFCELVVLHKRKETENFLLIPAAIDRAAARRAFDHAKRGGTAKPYSGSAAVILDGFATANKAHVLSRYLAYRKRFERGRGSTLSEESMNEIVVKEFEKLWEDVDYRLLMLPGKEALRAVNQYLQKEHRISVTPTLIIESMKLEEVPAEVVDLVRSLTEFAQKNI